MTNYTTKFNEEFNSTEIYFESKPTESEREALKENRFRWHSVKKCWYGRKTAEEVAQILGGSERTETAKEKPLTLEDLPEAIQLEDGGLYDGLEGANCRKWRTRDELKMLLLADFKRAGIKATIRAKRSGWSEALTITVKIGSDELKSFEEWRGEYNGDDINFINYLSGFGWICYTDESGAYKDIHSDQLNAMEDGDERRALCEMIIKSFYQRFITIEQDPNSYYKKSASVLKKSASDRVNLAKAIVSTYNHDQSNSMVDYFDRWIYDDYCVKIA